MPVTDVRARLRVANSDHLRPRAWQGSGAAIEAIITDQDGSPIEGAVADLSWLTPDGVEIEQTGPVADAAGVVTAAGRGGQLYRAMRIVKHIAQNAAKLCPIKLADMEAVWNGAVRRINLPVGRTDDQDASRSEDTPALLHKPIVIGRMFQGLEGNDEIDGGVVHRHGECVT